MSLRKRTLAFIMIFMLSIAIAGCSKQKASDSIAPAPDTVQTEQQNSSIKVITTSSELKSAYQDWAARLDALTIKTKEAYKPWAEGTTPVEQYLEQTRALYEEMKKLNIETDLKTEIELKKVSDEEKGKLEAIVSAYNKASKDLNDFLVTSNTRPDDEIKAKYKELIETKYQQDLKELNDLLSQIK